MNAPSDMPIRFPQSTRPVLALRRRVASGGLAEASLAARDSIRSFVSSTRIPWDPAAREEVGDRASRLEKSLLQLERLLGEREWAVAEGEVRLAGRERDLAEFEALLLAREKLLMLAKLPKAAVALVTKEEAAALGQWRAELERQEAGLRESKQALREREQFLEESEARLFEKVQAQQEKEVELEQKEEELRAKALRLREREAALDPAAAAALQAERSAARKFDEFNE